VKTAVIRARVPEDLKQDFEAAANLRGWNLSQAVRQLMQQYVTKEKELARRREESLEALEDIASGRIVEGEKVLGWLDTWGTAHEQEAPQ